MKKILILFVIGISFSVYSQNSSEMGGPPNRSELIGYWKKINIPNEEKMNKENPWPQKYQWFAFYEDGKISSMMSDVDYDYSSKDLEPIFKMMQSPNSPTFEVNGNFITIQNKQIENYQETWGANIFKKDLNEFIIKGTLVMSLDNGKGEVIYYRFLERIK